MTISRVEICLAAGCAVILTCIATILNDSSWVYQEVENVSIIDTDYEDPTSQLHDDLERWKDEAQELALNLNVTSSKSKPTIGRPFVFFHVRKAGGQTLRRLINNGADKSSINTSQRWIPCFNNLGCVPYSKPPTIAKIVYASHINYMEMVSLFQEKSTRGHEIKETQIHNKTFKYMSINISEPLFTCMTNIRPTVSRVNSCWNYRFCKHEPYKSMGAPKSTELSPYDWDRLLPLMYDNYNNGCNNEFGRIFGSLSADEVAINTMTIEHPFFLNEFNNIASRISKCVITRVDRCEDTNDIVAHFLPWMKGFDLCSIHNNKGESVGNITKDSQDIIIKQNYLDEMVYQFAEVLFEKQLEIARKSQKY